MLNDKTPLGRRLTDRHRPTGTQAAARTTVRASSSAWTTASIRTADPLIDPGVGSEIRILGIPGNQTTGQQRVPVIITSLRDDTVGTTVRGVQMYRHPQ